MMSIAPLAQKVRKVGGASENASPSDQSEAFAGFRVVERHLCLAGKWKAFIRGRGLVIGIGILTNGGGGGEDGDATACRLFLEAIVFLISRAKIAIRLFSIFQLPSNL